MIIKKWTNTSENFYGDDINANFYHVLTIQGLNTIRQLFDRSGVWSAGNIDGWGDAYIDVDGRENSVDTANTTALPSIYKVSGTSEDITLEHAYYPNLTDEASSDTTNDPDTFTNPSNAFDSNDTTYASDSFGSGTFARRLGKTFSVKNVDMVRVKAEARFNFSSGGSSRFDVYIETYDGSTWSTFKQIYSTANYSPGGSSSVQISIDGVVPIGESIQGVRVNVTSIGFNHSSSYVYIYSFEYGNMVGSSSLIYHNIPTGTFSSTISSAFGTPFYNDFETGASVEYKLTGSSGAEDTGWLNSNEVSSFTAFTAEPDTLIVRLTPKSSIPTAGFPSIKGFWVLAK